MAQALARLGQREAHDPNSLGVLNVVMACATGRLQGVVSPALLAELGAVLARPKLTARVSEEEARWYLAALEREMDLVEDPPPSPHPLTPDAKDDYLGHLRAAAERTR